MNAFIFKNQPNPHFNPWVYHENVFTPKECKFLTDYDSDKKRHLELSTYTNVDLVTMDWCNELDWLFQRLYTIIMNTNNYWYNFDLDGMFENLEKFTYNTHGGMRWHIDNTPQNNIATTRKLTFSIQLTDPCNYTGGELEFFHGETSIAPKDQGTVIIWPTYIYHRINELPSGTRTVLVGHAHGVPFR